MKMTKIFFSSYSLFSFSFSFLFDFSCISPMHPTPRTTHTPSQFPIAVNKRKSERFNVAPFSLFWAILFIAFSSPSIRVFSSAKTKKFHSCVSYFPHAQKHPRATSRRNVLIFLRRDLKKNKTKQNKKRREISSKMTRQNHEDLYAPRIAPPARQESLNTEDKKEKDKNKKEKFNSVTHTRLLFVCLNVKSTPGAKGNDAQTENILIGEEREKEPFSFTHHTGSSFPLCSKKRRERENVTLQMVM